jgi:hypothetical protein
LLHMYRKLHIPWQYGNNNLYLFYSMTAKKDITVNTRP